MSEEYRLDKPATLTCPECGGAVARQQDGALLQFRCHIGYVLSGETCSPPNSIGWKQNSLLAFATSTNALSCARRRGPKVKRAPHSRPPAWNRCSVPR